MWVREERKVERRANKGKPVYPRWAWVLCSLPGSVQSFSVSLSGAAARMHTAGMMSETAFSPPGPVCSAADSELFTITHAENL